MKKLRSSVFLFLLLFVVLFCAPSQKVFAATDVNSDITTDTVWDATGSPYLVSGQITIATDTTLTMSPGIVVLFAYGAEIDVAGKIIAEGTGDNKIYFSSNNDSTLNGDDVQSDDSDLQIPVSVGDYQGIIIENKGIGDFQNVEIRYAQEGIFSEKGILNVSNSVFANNNTPLEIDLQTGFTHGSNKFVDNTNNMIKLYGHSRDGYSFTYDTVPYSFVGYIDVNNNLLVAPGVIIQNSSGSALINVFSRSNFLLAGSVDRRITLDGVMVEAGDSPNFSMIDVDIKNSPSFQFSGANSTIELDSVNITNSETQFYLQDSKMNIKNSVFDVANDVQYGLFEFSGDTQLTFNDTTISNAYYAIDADDQGTVTADNLTIRGCDVGIILNNAVLDGNNITIQTSTEAAIVSTGGSIKLRSSEISANTGGVANLGNTDVDISRSKIFDNVRYGLFVNNDDIYAHEFLSEPDGTLVYSNSGEVVDVAGNWWGDISGPENNKNNSSGKGNQISEKQIDVPTCPDCFFKTNNNPEQEIHFIPWVVRDPSLSQKTPVLIVPGVLGTEISKPNNDGSNEKLWLDLGHNFTDIGDQFMDPLQFNDDLTPTDTSLVLGDVLRITTGTILNITFPLFNYSDGLISVLKNQGYTENSDIFVFPYDWRYGVNENTISQLKQKITDIMTETGSDKVDIVAHSTGGLLVKKYVMENLTTNNIDKVVFVGVPNTGAPKAIKTLLVGDKFDNIFLDQNEMQKLARNLPVVYDLAPSAEYYKNKGSFVNIVDENLFSFSSTDLNFSDMDKYLDVLHGFNTQAWINAKNLHTSDFDNFDMRTAGVDLYAIDGCKTGTITKIAENHPHDFVASLLNFSYSIKTEDTGDGTVPLESSTNLPINENQKFYALNANHGSMMSQDGIRQQITNIITDSTLPIDSNLITQDVNKCNLNGRAISVYSPVSIDITDQNGNHSGLSSDGVGIENTIPGADYEVLGEHKYVYLPTDTNQSYTIKLAGTGSGVFTLTDATIANNQTMGMQVFSAIPVSKNLLGDVNIGSTTTLTIDTDGNGTIDEILQPTANLNAIDAQNFDSEQFANSLKNNTDNTVAVQKFEPVSQSNHIFNGHPDSFLVVPNIAATPSVPVDTIQDSQISTSSIFEMKQIVYNKSNIQKNMIENTCVSELCHPRTSLESTQTESDLNNSSTSSFVGADVSESKIPMNLYAVLGGLVSFVGLAFISKKFSK